MAGTVSDDGRYKVLQANSPPSAKQLNELWFAGWRLVTIVDYWGGTEGGRYLIYLERQ